MNDRTHAVALLFLLFAALPANAAAPSTVTIPDKAGDYKNGIYHVGVLLDDIDEMVRFLADYSSLKVISRVSLPTGGERLFLSDARGQRLELYSNPARSRPHAKFAGHPHEDFVGMVHIAIEVDDVEAIKERVTRDGYPIVFQAPADFADGYVVSEVDAHRVLFIVGPSGVSFEFFEIKN